MPQFCLNIHENDDWALNDKFSYLPRLPFCPSGSTKPLVQVDMVTEGVPCFFSTFQVSSENVLPAEVISYTES